MLKKRKIIHRAVSILLASFIGIGSCISGYVNVRAESIALSGSFALIETLLMSMGYTCGLSDLATKPDSEIKDLEDKLNEWMKSDYDRIVEKYVASYPDLPPWGSPTPAPTSSPPVTIAPGEPVSQPMTWEEIQSQALKEKNLDLLKMGAATFWCLKQAVSDLWKNAMNIVEVEEGVPEGAVNVIAGSDYPYYLYYHYLASNGYEGIELHLVSKGFIYSKADTSFGFEFNDFKSYASKDGVSFSLFQNGVAIGGYPQVYKFYQFSTNLPVFSTKDDGFAWLNSQSNVYQPSKDDIWVVPTIKDAYDNNQLPSLPDTYPPAITIPSLQEFKDLAQQGDEDEENRPVILNEFITNHYVNTDPDPDPEPTPDPGGSGGEGGGTGGDSGDLDPAPSPTPTPDEENGQYKSPGLRNFFPFCIPFDLYDLFSNFTANRKAPRFEFPLKSERFGIDEKVVIDLAVFDEVAAVLRLLELILFVVILAVASRKLIGAL